ncbi:MAG TPA: glycosyltransferase family 4 protein [Pyrinomonadaceae bacterium]|nr:glycosyltransferase family 4 protein [Pyrinomonadaceae bacterium]
MRILQVCSVATFGGGERHLVDLARGLRARGHDVYAAAVPGSPLRAHLSFLPEENAFALGRRNYPKNLAGLARFVRERRIEIVHAHAARDYHLAALAVRLARRGRLVLTRHALFPLRRINRRLLKSAARVIAVSHAVADGLRRGGVIEPSRIAVVHNGVDLARYARPAAAGGDSTGRPFLVGTVGHLAPIKGHDVFLRAAALVAARRADVDFVIVGEDKSPRGGYRIALERLAGELGLGGRVTLPGWRDEVADALSSLSLFVSAARSEPFGLSIIEAMAAGLPVVAAASEGAVEIIADGTSGRLVPVGDAEALAGAINELLDDPSERTRLGQNALRAARQSFSLARMVADTERIYREVLSDVPE